LSKKENQNSPANNYTIENFSEHHLSDVLKIESASNITPWSQETFLKTLQSRSISFVISSEKKVIAFCIANTVLDECHLQNIAVIEELRGKGIGTFMLNILFKRAKLSDLHIILLEVRESNKRARKFYQNNGFEELFIRENYYKTKSGQENAVIMRLEVA
tara:strand:- start:18 stop:497 length:480 start_codon:yes stop_codon:yes gene_type:complete